MKSPEEEDPSLKHNSSFSNETFEKRLFVSGSELPFW